MNRYSIYVAAILLSSRSCEGFATNSNSNRLHCTSLHNSPEEDCNGAIQRRGALSNIFRGISIVAASTIPTTILSQPQPAQALDFDAFESSLITKDSATLIPKLNDDEALCKYGAPGKAMGEACARAGIKRKLPGDVDPTGKVDRGDYLKCVYEYPDMVKTRVCKPSKEWGPP